MKLSLHAFDLKLRDTFTISRESYDIQPTLIVELEFGGVHGFGEATANPFYGADVPTMATDLSHLDHWLAGLRPCDPVELWPEAKERLTQAAREAGRRTSPLFALCALDLALHDLWGKIRGVRLRDQWSASDAPCPSSDYTIGIDTIPKMIEKLRAFPGWPFYKIKLGTDRDVEIVTALRKETDAVLRVDANTGWSVDATLERAARLKDLGVEFIEQPLPLGQDADQRRLFAESPAPLVADESCQTEEDVDRCAGLFHGVNIKLVKCGGLTPAVRMIAKAKRLGLKTMVGCMTESSVGISAAAQLAPLVDWIDLDGAVLLAEDIAEGVRVERGTLKFPTTPGTGARLLKRPLMA